MMGWIIAVALYVSGIGLVAAFLFDAFAPEAPPIPTALFLGITWPIWAIPAAFMTALEFISIAFSKLYANFRSSAQIGRNGNVSPEAIAGISRDVAVAVAAQFAEQMSKEFHQPTLADKLAEEKKNWDDLLERITKVNSTFDKAVKNIEERDRLQKERLGIANEETES